MIKKIKIIIVITLMLIATNMIYVLLHELGHCLVAFLCGASITDFSIINRSMSFTGGEFNDITFALLQISGIIFPTIIGFCLLYIKSGNLIYHLFAASICFHTVVNKGALQAWIVVPLLSMYGTASADDDVMKFIEVTGINPLLVTVITTILTVGFIGILLKRSVIFFKPYLF